MPEQEPTEHAQQPAGGTEEFDHAGHHVVIRGEGEDATLLIDGRPEGFHVRQGGYVLDRDAYRPPEDTLRSAVEAHFDRLAEAAEKGERS